MKKKWLSVMLIILAICLVLPIVAACAINGNDTSGSTDSGNTDTSGGNNENDGDDLQKPTGGASVLESNSAPVVNYLRIAEIGENSVTVKFNLVGEANKYEVRYSNKEITDKNYENAAIADVTVTGDGAIKTFTIENLSVGKENKAHITVKAENDQYVSDYAQVRAGGIEIVVLDPSKPQTLSNGETPGRSPLQAR